MENFKTKRKLHGVVLHSLKSAQLSLLTLSIARLVHIDSLTYP